MEELIPRFASWKQLHNAMTTPIDGQLADLIVKRYRDHYLIYRVRYDGENEEWEYA